MVLRRRQVVKKVPIELDAPWVCSSAYTPTGRLILRPVSWKIRRKFFQKNLMGAGFQAKLVELDVRGAAVVFFQHGVCRRLATRLRFSEIAVCSGYIRSE